ncbi:MAG TPA: hypothetical protein VM864_02360 [Pyrinomonadaceae bacterium]|jgi:hypothetical protein|nr:hypothetical protein [Pyrinomonadaceae bacterium]
MMTTRGNNSTARRARATRFAAFAAVLLAAAALFAQAHDHGGDARQEPTRARAAFERFKKLEGNWKGRSTKGWEEAVSYKTIAGGSVVVGSSFDAHPDETMLTMVHMDNDRLMLTHYCVAKNQPRLVATSFSEDGRNVTFTFLDGANLPTRDRGHMDKAIFRFHDDDHVSSQWTWYQNGKEQWMEDIKLERQR